MQSSLQQSIEWIARGVDKENDYCESAFQLTVRSQFFLHIGFARYSAQLPARLFDARSFAPFSLSCAACKLLEDLVVFDRREECSPLRRAIEMNAKLILTCCVCGGFWGLQDSLEC